MPTYSQSTPLQLRKRLQELEDELESLAPGLVAEIRVVKDLLKAKDATASKTYESALAPWSAIELCLNLKGDFVLSKKDILREILDGGYMAAKPKSARGLLNDSLNLHLRNERLSLQGELVGRTAKKRSK